MTASALLWFPVACGGRVIGEPMPDDTISSPDAGTATKQSTGGSSGSSKADNPNGLVALPDCVLGKLESSLDQTSLDQTCPYLYDGRCYTTKVKACACACPNRSGTVCSSGFPSLEGTTAVACH